MAGTVIHISARSYLRLRREVYIHNVAGGLPVPRADLIGTSIDTVYGVRLVKNPMFPIYSSCTHCDGTGSGGKHSTYCHHCNGRGGYESEGAWFYKGMLTGTILNPLPRKFEPSFPVSVSLAPICKGLI